MRLRLRLRSHTRLGGALLVAGFMAWLAVRTEPGSGGPAPPLTTPGPHQRMLRGVVRAHDTDEWTLRFVVGHPATIEVRGEGGSRLYCAVRDAAGGLLDADGSGSSRCLLHLVPSRTGAYRVSIRNAGGTADAYRLESR